MQHWIVKSGRGLWHLLAKVYDDEQALSLCGLRMGFKDALVTETERFLRLRNCDRCDTLAREGVGALT